MPMKKINSIKFKNFKAFYDEETIQLDGKNILVYGENGSGKSSIFWGLYTFLQSSSKVQKDIIKYFVDFDDANADTYDSLKNIFSTSAEDAYIELGTLDTVSGTITIDKIDAVNTSTDIAKNNQPIALANASSDFINYKLLHNFYNVTHKQEINLWQVFIRDIFPFFRNNEREKYYAERIDELTKSVPKSSGGVKNLKIGSRPQVEYVQKIDNLNNDIQIFLNEIEQNANFFLKEHFFDSKDVLKVFLSYNTKIDYNSIRFQDKSKTNYSISLNLELWDDLLKTWKKVKRPHSFLNEAQLTRVAIAVRIGALQTRLQNREYQILCLDDMLISLDMGNRDKVLQTFLNTEKKVNLEYFDKFQKLIFTHDKAFYNLCKQRIRLSLDEKDWYFKEIYLDTDKVPQRPFIDNSTDYFERAEKHLKAFDYPASANALRQGLENIIFNFLPENERYTFNKEGITVVKTLDGLLTAFKVILKNHTQNLSLINDLFIYKDHLLNPLSHNNIKTAVFKQELQKLLQLTPLLKSLESTTLKKLSDIPTIIKFIDTNATTGDVTTYHLAIKENLVKYKLLDGIEYLSKTECVSVKSVLPDGTERLHNHHCKNLRDCAKKIAFNLGTTYADDMAILSKLDLS
jgi:energy-coupling factor transporter ATP-binding protein EcfA2